MEILESNTKEQHIHETKKQIGHRRCDLKHEFKLVVTFYRINLCYEYSYGFY